MPKRVLPYRKHAHPHRNKSKPKAWRSAQAAHGYRVRPAAAAWQGSLQCNAVAIWSLRGGTGCSCFPSLVAGPRSECCVCGPHGGAPWPSCRWLPGTCCRDHGLPTAGGRTLAHPGRVQAASKKAQRAQRLHKHVGHVRAKRGQGGGQPAAVSTPPAE